MRVDYNPRNAFSTVFDNISSFFLMGSNFFVKRDYGTMIAVNTLIAMFRIKITLFNFYI